MKLALWDLDGTLADDSHRVDHAIARRWTQYFDPYKVANDSVIEEGRDMLLDLYEDGWGISYLTGRRNTLFDTSSNWLDYHGFPNPEQIKMRTFAEDMPLADFKVMVIGDLLSTRNYDEVVLFDDDPEVIRLVRETYGSKVAVHCTWRIKPKSLVKSARG